MSPRETPSTITLMWPLGSLRDWTTTATTPISWMSSAWGSSTFGSFWAARKICFSGAASASSSAAMEEARPTTKGAIIRGKTTMSRSGTSGSVRVAVLSGGVAGEVIRVYLLVGELWSRAEGAGPGDAGEKAVNRPS